MDIRHLELLSLVLVGPRRGPYFPQVQALQERDHVRARPAVLFPLAQHGPLQRLHLFPLPRPVLPERALQDLPRLRANRVQRPNGRAAGP